MNSEIFLQRRGDTTSTSCPAHHTSPTVNFHPKRTKHTADRTETRDCTIPKDIIHLCHTFTIAKNDVERVHSLLWVPANTLGGTASHPMNHDGTIGTSLGQNPPLKRVDPAERCTAVKAIQTYAGGNKCLAMHTMFKTNAAHPTFAAHSTEPRMATTQAQQPDVSPAFFAQSVYVWIGKWRKKRAQEIQHVRHLQAGRYQAASGVESGGELLVQVGASRGRRSVGRSVGRSIRPYDPRSSCVLNQH